jgi:hypothetical protein
MQFLVPPALVIGCGHSGTSLMVAMLSEHPDIFTVPKESYFLTKDSVLVSRLFITKFTLQTILHNKQMWVEKTPRHLHFVKKMLTLNARTRFICMVRDGRDVAVSFRERGWPLDAAIDRWVDDGKIWCRLHELPNMHTVKYESLVECPEKEIRAVCNHLGLLFNENMLHPERTKKTWYSRNLEKPSSASGKNHEQYRNWQINQPIFDGRGRWKTKMNSTEEAYFWAKAGPMMSRLGYS